MLDDGHLPMHQCIRLALPVLALVAGGCATDPDTLIAPAPERSWTVPETSRYSVVAAGRAEAAQEHGQHAAGPPAIDPAKTYELAELIDIAQRTNPETRIAWENARQAAIKSGLAESVYAPVLTAQASAAYQAIPLPFPTTLTPQGFFVFDTYIFLPALTLKWLLYDFGGKRASVEATRELLAAANFGFNATHQKVVFDVTRAYYALNAVQGRVETARAALKLAQTLQDAAEARRSRGLATLPEVLQAREQTARAAYELEESIAGATDARMALLAAMGIRPTTQLRVAGLSGRMLPPALEDTADKLVDRALAQRPDLLARVAVVRAREAEIRKAQSGFYPRIVFGANVGQAIGGFHTQGIPGWSSVNEPTYGASIAIELPLYDGGLRTNQLGLAKSQRRTAEDELELARDQTVRQVVKAYEDLKVALRKREAAVALLGAAEKSHDAAIDSYRNALATFVDVSNAQTALTKARTADTESRSSVFAAAASLAFSTGDLAPPAKADVPGSATFPRDTDSERPVKR
jgi:outer membrane protein